MENIQADKLEFLQKLLIKPIYEEFLDIAENGAIIPKRKELFLSILSVDICPIRRAPSAQTREFLFDDLNEYLERMTAIIQKNGGHVENIVGDAIIAVFGLYKEQETQQAACTAAKEIMNELAIFNSENKTGIEFEIGIGVTCGIETVGMFGSRNFIQLKVVGNHINLANRLQNMTAHYKVKMLASGEVVDSLEEKSGFTFIEHLSIKGNEKGIDIYEMKT